METSDELIRQGNVLIVAAREGKVGLVEEEIKAWQKAYIDRKRVQHPTAKKYDKIAKGGMYVGLASCSLILIAGLLTDFLTFIIGLFSLSVILFTLALGKRQALFAKKYEEVVAQEFPKFKS
jgi:hypothetical protein